VGASGVHEDVIGVQVETGVGVGVQVGVGTHVETGVGDHVGSYDGTQIGVVGVGGATQVVGVSTEIHSEVVGT
jgi:hypothetical protein